MTDSNEILGLATFVAMFCWHAYRRLQSPRPFQVLSQGAQRNDVAVVYEVPKQLVAQQQLPNAFDDAMVARNLSSMFGSTTNVGQSPLPRRSTWMMNDVLPFEPPGSDPWALGPRVSNHLFVTDGNDERLFALRKHHKDVTAYDEAIQWLDEQKDVEKQLLSRPDEVFSTSAANDASKNLSETFCDGIVGHIVAGNVVVPVFEAVETVGSSNEKKECLLNTVNTVMDPVPSASVVRKRHRDDDLAADYGTNAPRPKLDGVDSAPANTEQGILNVTPQRTFSHRKHSALLPGDRIPPVEGPREHIPTRRLLRIVAKRTASVSVNSHQRSHDQMSESVKRRLSIVDESKLPR